MHSISEIGTNVPAFLGKLWKMVEDPETNDLISWDSDGLSFVIKDDNRFARELLPMYYKHNNWSSFVRQLNMYGFHKITSPDSGSMKVEPPDEIKFSHPCFVRGHSYLLDNIKRKIGLSKVYPNQPGEKYNLNKVLADMQQMKGRQENMDSRLTAMKIENETLWRELSILRQKHIKQQQMVNKLIQFLVSIVQQNSFSVKRKYPRMIVHNKGARLRQENTLQDTNSPISSPTGPVIHELESAEAETLLDGVVEETETETSPEDVTDYFLTQPSEDIDEVVVNADVPGDELILGMPQNVLIKNRHHKDSSDNKTRTTTHLYVPKKEPQIRPKILKVITSKQPKKLQKNQIRVGSVGPVTSESSHQQKATAVQQNIRVNPQQTTISLQRIGNNRQKIKFNEWQLPQKNQQQLLIKKQPVQSKQQQTLQKRKQQPEGNSQFLLKTKKDQQVESQQKEVNQEPVEQELILPDQGQSTEPIINIPFDNGSTTTSSDMMAEVYAGDTTDFSIPVVVEVPPLGDTVQLVSPQAPQDLLLASPSVTSSHTEPAPSPVITSPTPRSDMQVACVDDSQVNGTPPLTRGEMDDHLENVQTDLENLKELLRSEGISLDANALLGYFNDDLLSYNLSDPVSSEEPNNSKESPGNELMTYNPSLFDLTDLMGSEWNLPTSPPPNENLPTEDSFAEVNTPQFVPQSPSFPTAAKKRKK
uniref:HSF-type DNA-binding domain-containing protein n=1 Tax=Homalodisca liturata TaxID=320908 RepID=A0A1B6IIZ7_9HEMI